MRAFVVKVTLGSPCVFGALAVSDPILQTERHCRANGLAATDGVTAYFHKLCSPASPSCLEPALPTQITSHRTEFTGSSTTSSTTCPGLSLKLPRNRNPSWDLSTIRQGYIFGAPPRLVTRLARFFNITRIERRPCGIRRLSILYPYQVKVRQNPAYPNVSIQCSTGASSWMPTA